MSELAFGIQLYHSETIILFFNSFKPRSFKALRVTSGINAKSWSLYFPQRIQSLTLYCNNDFTRCDLFSRKKSLKIVYIIVPKIEIIVLMISNKFKKMKFLWSIPNVPIFFWSFFFFSWCLCLVWRINPPFWLSMIMYASMHSSYRQGPEELDLKELIIGSLQMTLEYIVLNQIARYDLFFIIRSWWSG